MKRRARRRHDRERVIAKRCRQVRIASSPRSAWEPIPGAMWKQSPFDCGRSACQVCSRGKRPRELTRQELVAVQDERDG